MFCRMNARAAEEHAELRRIAVRLMAAEHPGHTLRPTALAHEAWLKLQREGGIDRTDRDSLLAIAAWAMRRILIDHARRRRVRAARRTTLTGKAVVAAVPETDVGNDDESLVQLDASLRGLAAHDGELAHLVELRFFAGATVEETARVLGISARTVKRRWAFARAWLQNDMRTRGAGR